MISDEEKGAGCYVKVLKDAHGKIATTEERLHKSDGTLVWGHMLYGNRPYRHRTVLM